MSTRLTALQRVIVIVHLDRKAVPCGRWVRQLRPRLTFLRIGDGWSLPDARAISQRLAKPHYRWQARR